MAGAHEDHGHHEAHEASFVGVLSMVLLAAMVIFALALAVAGMSHPAHM